MMVDVPCLSEEKITLFSGSNDEVFVWRAEDVRQLRTKYRIVGSLIGSLPRKPRQNVYLSLPMTLSKDETTLVLEKKFAILVQSETNTPLPSQEEVDTFRIARQESIHGQLELFEEENKERKKELADVIGEGRRKKHRKRHREYEEDENTQSKLLKTESNLECNVDDKAMSSWTFDDIDENKAEQERVERYIENDPLQSPHSIAMTPMQTFNHPQMEGKHVKDNSTDLFSQKGQNNRGLEHKESTKESAKESAKMEQGCAIHIPTKISLTKTRNYTLQDWSYPETEMEKLHYQVFYDLWQKGLYITSGSKFGGHFLAYPGDPVKFHSFYIITVVPKSKKIGMLELISLGRLAATVKKTAVLSTVNDKGNIVHSSIKWSGIS